MNSQQQQRQKSMRRQMFCALFVMLQSLFSGSMAYGQTEAADSISNKTTIAADSTSNQTEAHDTFVTPADSVFNRLFSESARMAEQPLPPTATEENRQRDWSSWRPNAQRALWLALVVPGGGQIYNRKYWKLPLVYGGFMGCIYAMSWNNMMYKDYQQAYIDIMDDDPNTASYNKFLHLGRTIDDSNIERYKQIFKSRKDKYRRWRDMSFFVMVGVYALSVIDAYVDAELSEFDISKDLTMKVSPAVMSSGMAGNTLQNASIGVNCSLNF